MPLSNNLVTNFVKATKDDLNTTNKESIVYGKISKVITSTDGEGKVHNKYYVRIDGSNYDTPVSSFTSAVNEDERVIVMIKNRSAIITGNITTASINENSMGDAVNNTINEQFTIVSEVKVRALWEEE